MGDHGKLYRTYTPELVEQIRLLVQSAAVITPNLTEAYLLLGETYRHEPLTIAESGLDRQFDKAGCPVHCHGEAVPGEHRAGEHTCEDVPGVLSGSAGTNTGGKLCTGICPNAEGI